MPGSVEGDLRLSPQQIVRLRQIHRPGEEAALLHPAAAALAEAAGNIHLRPIFQNQQQFCVGAKPREVEAGSKVRMAGQDMVGVVQSVKGRKAQVAFGQILTTVDRKMLTVVSNSEFREATRPQTARTVVSADISARKLSFKDHIDVRGMRAAEALDAVQDFIDDALDSPNQKDCPLLFCKHRR